MTTIINIIDTFLDRIFALLGVLFFSQLPEFFQQYTQRLAGHVEELALQVHKIEQISSLSGKTVHEYILKFLQSSDTDFTNQGMLMENLVERFTALQQARITLEQAPFYTKPLIFLRSLQFDIAQAAYRDFVPGFSFSLEGLCYAIMGMFIGILLYRACKYLLLLPFSRARK